MKVNFAISIICLPDILNDACMVFCDKKYKKGKDPCAMRKQNENAVAIETITYFLVFNVYFSFPRTSCC